MKTMKLKHIFYTSLILILFVRVEFFLAQTSENRGEIVFESCKTCHSINRSEANMVGPSLFGVFGRKSGQVEGFRYSPALKKSNITWSLKNLDAYISDPQKMIPGNRMPFDGISSTSDRADLLAYMQKVFK